mmetsp:Transcript_13254/g.32357  ORF Transcript_13254/g.32357 Transcript_13254/m.32357 type:complete len:87 (-) Transcript_13254:706-966(-)
MASYQPQVSPTQARRGVQLRSSAFWLLQLGQWYVGTPMVGRLDRSMHHPLEESRRDGPPWKHLECAGDPSYRSIRPPDLGSFIALP